MTRRNMFIAGAVAGLVLILWYLLLWSPRKADLAEARDRREEAEVVRDELAIRVARLRASQKDEPMKRAQVEALRTTIPDDPNLAAFILDTNDAASKAGIDFISISPSEPAAAAGVGAAATATAAGGAAPTAGPLPAEIKLQLQITGGYFQVLDFLNRVGEMPRLIITDGLNVNSDEKAKLSVGISARMFVRSVPAGYGGVPAAPVTTPAPSVDASVTPPPAASHSSAHRDGGPLAVPATTTSGARS